jgi:Ca2+-binding EF-hand superfamily protein
MNSSTANAGSSLNATTGFYGPGAAQFKTIDTDADGRISRAEFTASASLDLSLDADRDGIVTASERAAAPTGQNSALSRRSSDGTADSDPAQTFAKLDADNDGFLSQNELASANAKLRK